MGDSLEERSQGQKERLAFVEFLAYFLGEVRRSDIINQFGVKTAAATRDIALYRSISNDNIALDSRTKTYIAQPNFNPVFEHSVDRVLSALSLGFGQGAGRQSRPMIPCEIPRLLHQPDVSVLAPITRAINRKKVARIAYSSFTSGATQREIVPFALANNGLRWHIRAYCRKRARFLDFTLTRIASSELVEDSAVEENEDPANDIQWSRIVELELVPHPSKIDDLSTIAMDYGMSMQDPVRIVRVRAALAGYFLRQWSVDCSEDHSCEGKEVRLWLRNPLALYGVESADLAPGFKKREV